MQHTQGLLGAWVLQDLLVQWALLAVLHTQGPLVVWGALGPLGQ